MRLLLILLLLPLSAAATVGDDQPDTDDTPVFPLPPLAVEGREATGAGDWLMVAREWWMVDGDLLMGWGRAPTLAQALEALPGISAERRGPGALEPVIRGLGGDRLTTRLNGLHLPIASPTRTASPLNYFGPLAPVQLAILRGLPSVTLGPVPTGAVIELSTTPESPSNYPPTTNHQLLLSAVSNPDGLTAAFHYQPSAFHQSPTTNHQPSTINYSLTTHYTRHGDYEGGGDGGEVDADYRAGGAGAAGRWRSGRHELDWSAGWFRQELARNPSLPLDTKNTDAVFLTLGHRLRLADGRLALRAGYADIRPFLDNADRPAAPGSPVARVEADGAARALSFGGNYTAPLAAGLLLQGGADFSRQTRDSLRFRRMVSGAVLVDHIWPDLVVEQPGAFLEISRPPAPDRVAWRLGGRVERAAMRARALDDQVSGIPGARGPTIRDNFVAFNGPAAGRDRVTDWTGAANFLLSVPLAPHWTLEGGLGAAVAAPGPTERYRAFLSALGGGVELGNPALKPETKYEARLAVAADLPRLRLHAEAWAARIDDFVARQAILAAPLIYSFRNTDADLHGFDLSLAMPIPSTTHQQLIAQISRTYGDPPDLPPWEARAALRLALAESLALEPAVRHTAAARNPRPDLLPLYRDTPSATLLDLSLSFARPPWSLVLTVDNLLDRAATAYLQPPDPATGRPVPLPGRSLRAAVRAEF